MKAGWKTVRLEEVCAVDFGERVVRKNDAGTMYPVYGGGGATFNIDRHNRESCVVVSRFGMSERCVRFVDGRFFLNDSGLTVTSTSPEVSQGYINLLLHAKAPEIYALGGGTAQKNLDTKSFRRLEIPLPKLAEQKRIEALLEEAFAGMDEAQILAEARHELFQELRESYLESLIAAGEGWAVTTVADCADISTGFAFKSSGFSDSEADVRLLGGDNIMAGAVRWENIRRWPKTDSRNYKDFFLATDDVVLAMDRPIVNTGLKISMISNKDVPALLIQRTARMRAKAAVCPQFLYLTLSSKRFINYLSSSQKGAGVPHVSSRQIGSFVIKLPPKEEQQRIVKLLSEIDAAAKGASNLMDCMVNNLLELKSSLLKRAFDGELTV